MRGGAARIWRIVLACMVCLPLVGARSASGGRVLKRDKLGSLWEYRGGKPARLIATHLNHQRFKIGTVTYYAYPVAGKHDDALIIVAECDSRGVVRREHRVQDERIARATCIMDGSALPGGRIFLDLHINPSEGVGVEIMPATGKHRSWAGYGFTWDKSARHVAYFKDPPHFDRNPSLMGSLCVDGRLICHVQRSDWGELKWNGNTLSAKITTPEGKKRLLMYDAKAGKSRMRLLRG